MNASHPTSECSTPRIFVHDDAEAAARAAAAQVAAEARAAVTARGRFLLALSGGRTPEIMFRALAEETVPWPRVHVFQVDERAAPEDCPDRNWNALRDGLLDRVALPAEQRHPMPVDSPDLEAAAADYARRLVQIAGRPPVLDLVHLGLGADGHTASLVPGDPALDVFNAAATIAGPYQGRRRLTLTFSTLNRARRVLWLVVGAEKAEMLARLARRDPTIPAGRVQSPDMLIYADRAAARLLQTAFL